jgi:hypothetical protein
MAKRFRETGTPSVKEIEADISKALNRIAGTPAEQAARVKHQFEVLVQELMKPVKSNIARVNTVRQTVALHWACGSPEDHFGSIHGERHLTYELERALQLHSFPKRGEGPRCDCYLAPVEIETFRPELVKSR